MEYVNASSVQQVLDTLAQADGGAVVLAGGTDLMVDFKAGKVQPQVWVDVTRVPELCGITVEDGKLVIGAAVTLTTIARSPLVRQYFPSLAQGCGTVGSLQIRNSATLVGNVVSAQPAGDGAMSLAPLAPTFTVLSAQGARQLSMGEMYAHAQLRRHGPCGGRPGHLGPDHHGPRGRGTCAGPGRRGLPGGQASHR